MAFMKSKLRLSYIVEPDFLAQDNWKEKLKVLSDAGVTSFFVRIPASAVRSLNERLSELQAAISRYKAYFFVFDSLLLATKLNADGILISGVNTAQGLVSAKRAREVLGPRKHIGAVLSSEVGSSEFASSESSSLALNIDFAALGPLFHFGDKFPNAIGVQKALNLRSKFPKLPCLFFGGIDSKNISTLPFDFADGVLVSRSLNIQSADAEVKNVHQALGQKLGPSVFSAGLKKPEPQFRFTALDKNETISPLIPSIL